MRTDFYCFYCWCLHTFWENLLASPWLSICLSVMMLFRASCLWGQSSPCSVAILALYLSSQHEGCLACSPSCSRIQQQKSWSWHGSCSHHQSLKTHLRKAHCWSVWLSGKQTCIVSMWENSFPRTIPPQSGDRETHALHFYTALPTSAPGFLSSSPSSLRTSKLDSLSRSVSVSSGYTLLLFHEPWIPSHSLGYTNCHL